MEMYPDQEWWERYAVKRPRRQCTKIVNEFRSLIERAPLEREIQTYLETFPWLLAEQFPHCHYVIPQFRFGASYVADFVAPERSSGGTTYYFIEIEQPSHNLITKGGKFSAPVRDAIEQVQEWRRFLLDNFEYARRSRSNNGLGLHDLTRYLVGQIYIGRRSEQSEKFNQLRQTLLEQSLIEIASYDRLIEWAAYRARFWDGYDS